ncbi:MAG: 3'-5' exonuclease [Bacteroidaceae bacterium]
MIIRSCITKEEIAGLQRVDFEGKITVIDSTAECDKAVAFLKTQTRVGIDTETRPSFQRGRLNKIALFQISTNEHCFLFRLCCIENPKSLIDFLSSNDTQKIGLSLHDDRLSMARRYPFSPAGWLDLQNYVGRFGITDMSLQKIYAILFEKKISKSQRLSNWESESLSPAQQQYAAIDAWACLQIFQLLEHLKETNDYQIKVCEKQSKAFTKEN